MTHLFLFTFYLLLFTFQLEHLRKLGNRLGRNKMYLGAKLGKIH